MTKLLLKKIIVTLIIINITHNATHNREYTLHIRFSINISCHRLKSASWGLIGTHELCFFMCFQFVVTDHHLLPLLKINKTGLEGTIGIRAAIN